MDVELSQAIHGRPFLKHEYDMSYIGLLSKDELNKTHTDIGVELNYATTLLHDDADGAVTRDDSKVLEEKMCAACKAFRALDDGRHCKVSDEDHAKSLLGITYSDISQAAEKLDGCKAELWEMSTDYANQYAVYK